MNKILLPELRLSYYNKVGVKNTIEQIVLEKAYVDYFFQDSYRGYIVILVDGNHICVTSNKDFDFAGFDYILLSHKKPTEQDLETEGDTIFRRWLKHPLKKSYSNVEIINSWGRNFNFLEEDIEANVKGLREPQIAALYSILSHLKVSEEIGTVVMPTGTGKTETMLSTLIAGRLNKVIITVPSDALRTQISNKFLKLGLLKQFGIVNSSVINPKVGVIYQGFRNEEDLLEFVEKSNVIVTTMNILSNLPQNVLTILNSHVSNILIDEAHHIEAKSWKSVRKAFDNYKILQFTATPFRNDQKRIEGKVIFNFSLKKAQEQGYFKPINFLPIREYDLKKGHQLIAQKAVDKLREDLDNGYSHILMARCVNKVRAEEIFKYYEEYEDLNPVLIHSSISGKNEILQNIVNGNHKIIVAVNMLGEGFDLPQLKIAAFHDIRKSLPITLQFAGRFTRTSIDNNLGNATFIANLADSDTENELSDLYAQDSDWNILLSRLSSGQIDEQIDFEQFINGFQHLDDSKIPFQNIKFSLSTVVYKNLNTDNSFDLSNFKKGIKGYDELEYKFNDINPNGNTVVIITASKSEVEWVNYKEVFGLDWKLTILYYNEENNLLFIHSSDKSSLYNDLAKAVLKDNTELINKLLVYRSFYDVKRVSLQNVGLKEFLNRRIRFTMRVGTDIQEALSLAEQQRGEKAFVFGSGFEEGNKITLGCSYKGRIWSYLRNDLKGFIEWCNGLGKKLQNENIDPNQVLRDTLIPTAVNEIPHIYPTYIDWDDNFYSLPESKIEILINGQFNSAYCTIELVDENDQGIIDFRVITPNGFAKFRKELFIETDPEGNNYPNFRIVKLDMMESEVKIGSKVFNLIEYLNQFPPMVWFADGSVLQGNEYVELKQQILPYPVDLLISRNWDNIDLSKESQGIMPLKTNSIQYSIIEELKYEDFDIIYDDDYSGEIADVITIKEHEKEINVQFYHLKFAKDGSVNTRIDNFYEVCGQAQKSVNWIHKSGSEFFQHLLRREVKSRSGHERSRIEKGTKADLERFLAIAKNKKPMNFEIFIVQPSLSKQNTSESIMTLLGVTANYLKEVGNVNLKVIVNE
ncbi:DEAD/DEAH box helicase family protein [Myroides marinus]|uniref:DEAD/DEAH box helicase n=1 Tax=Myroides TaxID=76831 RepID=UPI0025767FF2|nr:MULTISPECIES: DEAD/DEAH box helicase family protein [Myroides]MDM1391303.1 DEAD/DEAH box helicase family protein [Myroides marinus]MDM1452515.1 DEAD/DEAH box helicase family protein [Myroides odoratimimus]MDM1455765.1 DEAD/DEAH box helicase family protein [Myroides odoratimimus]MDM1476240.1 DEAD/DEAH box helicase family protein [Myroides odoratimimus]MDM1488767.1 DEAD/DEAH box helicase family protein [Myroides odoratimimus]